MNAPTATRRAKFWAITGVLGVFMGLAAWAVYADVLALLQPQTRLLKLRRTCDHCPNYAITLSGDGLLTYEGGDFAVVRGKRQSVVDAATVEALFDAFVQSEFVDMDNSYPSPAPERMTVSLTVQIGAFTKSVFSEERYGPALRQALERKMDDLPGMRVLSGWTF